MIRAVTIIHQFDQLTRKLLAGIQQGSEFRITAVIRADFFQSFANVRVAKFAQKPVIEFKCGKAFITKDSLYARDGRKL
jgi:hypothetical protein